MGLTDQGFTPKTTQEIRDSISDNLKISLGSDIDTSPSSRIGQMIDIFSNEINDAWQGLQGVYNSFYPDTSSGTSLDNVVAITNTQRKQSTVSTAEVFLGGTATTIIPANSVVQKTGTTSNFTISQNTEISDEANIIIVPEIPDSGTITLEWDGTPVTPINFNDDQAAIKAAIEAHPDITTVTILGTLDSVRSFHIYFEDEDLTSREPSIDASDLERNSEPLEPTATFASESTVQVKAQEVGPTSVPATSLTTIVSAQVGWDSVINYDIGVEGNNTETDAELRERREEELQKSGTCTLGGAKERIQEVAFVGSVTIIENPTSATVDGRPPHSYEVYVEGGDDDEVAQAIYDTKPSGILTVSTNDPMEQRSGQYIDVNNEEKTLIYSEPVPVPIEIVVTITTDFNYPSDGDDQIKLALVTYINSLELGDDVLNHLLYTPVNTVPGITTLTIEADTVAGGTPSENNIVIAPNEVATLSDSDVTVTEI